jgi:hypothetical protein
MTIMSQTHRTIAPALSLVLLAVGLCLSAPASAQDNDQTEEEQTEEEQTEEEQAEEEQAQQDQAEQDQASSLRRGNRMEFDARLIRGESAGSGAVFLFERGQRPLPSMINKRKSFLRDTVGSVLGTNWAEKFEQAQSQDSD